MLQVRFKQLKNLCEKKGLFSVDSKKKLPTLMRQVGVITSATGAALQDILKVLKRRSPMLSIIIYPAIVQGSAGAASICQALKIANQRAECDALILARGGGSLEDLWCFNEESVALSIHNSTLPIITGVGHETDITIADLCADYRAATPSAAAEVISTDQQKQRQLLQQYYQLLQRGIIKQIQYCENQLKQLKLRLRHPSDKLNEVSQTIDQLEHRVKQAIKRVLERALYQLQQHVAKLHTLSPLNTLARGYSITRDKDNHIVTSTQGVRADDHISIDLCDGKLIAEVKKVIENNQGA